MIKKRQIQCKSLVNKNLPPLYQLKGTAHIAGQLLPHAKGFVRGFLSWQTSLLCIVGELAVGGSVAVAVGIGDW